MLKNSYLGSVDNKDGTARKAAKYLSQACKNFLPAQGVKMEVGKSANELINHKPQIYELILQIQGSALRRAEKKRA